MAHVPLFVQGNHYSKMFELTDSTGGKLFETISITLVCDECLKTDTPEKCTHKLAEMPRWLSSQKMEVVRSLLADDPAMLLRESMGISADATTKAFPSTDVDRFMKNIMTQIPVDIFCPISSSNTNHIVVAIDPAGGGSSQFAITSICQLPNGGIMVLGCDALRTKDVRQTHELLVRHIEAARKHPQLHRATAVLVLESNLAFEAQHIVHALNLAKERGKFAGNWVALSEGAGGTIGWLTTNERKEAMCFQLRDALRVGCIGVSSHFFTLTASGGKREMLNILGDEMKNFCVLVEPPKNPFGKTKKTYSGKVITLQLAITGCRTFYQSDRYNSFRPTL